MKKDPRIFLEHILESIGDVEDYTRKSTVTSFIKDKKTQDAVLRKLGIIGEAAKNLPVDFKKQHTAIKWHEIAGMRNILIHEYFGIHLKIVWNSVKKDIPKLKKAIQKLLEEVDSKEVQVRL